MGRRLIALASVDSDLRIVAALESPQHSEQGIDAGLLAGVGDLGVPVTSDWHGTVDVVIDFSVPAASMALLARCVERDTRLVLATTGFSDAQQQAIRDAGRRIPLCWAPSMSLTVNLAMKLCEIAGRALADHPTGADVEIIERHHRFKEDAPSGTALAFGNIIAKAMGQSQNVHGREGRPGVRPHDEIGYHAVRAGDNPGEHTIIFGLIGETLELRVAATNRDCYAHGALIAATWLSARPAGLYNMQDVLGL
jgi:4-hydroxy-tetrahydrodipicolinate reductase